MNFSKKFLKNFITADNLYTQLNDFVSSLIIFSLSLILIFSKNSILLPIILIVAGLRWVLNIFLIRIQDKVEIQDENCYEIKTRIKSLLKNIAKDFILDFIIECIIIFSMILFFIGSILSEKGIAASLLLTCILFLLNVLDKISKYLYVFVLYARKVLKNKS